MKTKSQIKERVKRLISEIDPSALETAVAYVGAANTHLKMIGILNRAADIYDRAEIKCELEVRSIFAAQSKTECPEASLAVIAILKWVLEDSKE